MKTQLHSISKFKTSLFCTIFMMFAASLSAQNYYPTNPNTDLSQTSNWTTSVSGIGGTNPPNFTTAGQVFYVIDSSGANNANPTILSAWTVSGAGSGVVIGEGINAVNFIIPAANSLTGTIININANATLKVSNLTGITWPTIANPASTVDFLNLNSVTIPLTVTYGNVILDNTILNNAVAGGFDFTGNLTLQNGASFNPTSVAIDLVMSGANNQTITGNSLTINCNKFMDSLKTNGNTALAANTNIKTLSSLQLHQTGSTNTFSDGGNTITCGNNVNTWGVASAFNFTGTLILNGSSGTQKIDNNNTNSAPTAAVAAFNNITINCTGSGKVSFITSAGTNPVINIKGNLVNNLAGTGTILLVSTSPLTGVDTFNIGGNLSTTGTTPFTYNAHTIYNFNGSSPQTLTTSIATPGEVISNLEISNSNGVILNSAYSILAASGSFNLNKGVLNTTLTHILTLNAGSTATGGSATSYVNGPLAKKGNTAFTFPVGGNGHYAPIGISAPANATDAFTASYAFACASANPAFNTPLTNVSADETWSLNETAGSDLVNVIPSWQNNAASGISTFDGTLVVASYSAGSWSSIGQSSITAGTSGNVSSTSIQPPASAGEYTFGSTNATSNPLLTPIGTTLTINNYNCGGNTGSITAVPSGGNEVYSYSWAPAGGTSITATGLTAANYTVTVNDANGCSASAASGLLPGGFSITNITSTLSSCGGSTGTATVTAGGGTTAYTYAWSNSGTTSGISALSAGLYTVTVTDAHTCNATSGVTVSTPNAPRDSIINITNNLCYGDNSGTITVGVQVGTPPYTFAWSTATTQTNAMATSLTAGTYTVVITDAAHCVSSSNGTLVDPAQLRDSAVSIHNGCGTLHNGSATAGVIGGTGAYTYSWNTNPVQTSLSATGLSAGTYTLSVNDANNCTTNSFFTIVPGTIPTVTFNLAADSIQCDTVTQVVLTSFASPTGGTFTGTDVSANAFHPHTAGNGSYAIKYKFTNGSGCSDSATQSIRVKTCSVTGIGQISANESSVVIYPNPNNGQFNLSGLTKGAAVEVYNEIGMLIGSTKAVNETMTLNISDKTNGMYLVRIISADGASSSWQKVIKLQ